VTRTESIDLVRSLGADEVIDYRKEDFTRRKERYDVIYDIGGTRSFGACRRVMSRKGTLVVVGGVPGKWLAPVTRILKAFVYSPFVPQRFAPMLAHNDPADLALLAELVQSGTIRPVIDKVFPLRDAAEAIRYLGTGHPRGKVVVRIE
jgi:NADPH:quinone reductase-like Zn-dependent oxidoreductase